MCGIVACKHNKEQIQSEIIKKALKKISHRGPDSNGIYISPAFIVLVSVENSNKLLLFSLFIISAFVAFNISPKSSFILSPILQ